jgi:hypothetical protein
VHHHEQAPCLMHGTLAEMWDTIIIEIWGAYIHVWRGARYTWRTSFGFPFPEATDGMRLIPVAEPQPEPLRPGRDV